MSATTAEQMLRGCAVKYIRSIAVVLICMLSVCYQFPTCGIPLFLARLGNTSAPNGPSMRVRKARSGQPVKTGAAKLRICKQQ